MKIAFLGLGNMGGPMATNIARSEHGLTIFDLSQDKMAAVCAAVPDQTVTCAKSPQEAVKDADIVFTSLPSPKVIDAVMGGTDGVLAAMSAGSIWVDLSTNNLDTERKLRALAEKLTIEMLDSPVTGGVEGAAAGTLVLLVGGARDVFDKCLPVLKLLGKEAMHLGDHGAGYVAKISQVVLCYLHSVALSEAMMLGVKGGVSPEKMLEIIQTSTGASYVADRYGPAILDGSYDPGFALGLAHKDMALTLELAQSIGATLPICNQVEDIYRRATDAYGFDANHLKAVQLLEEENKTFLRSLQNAPHIL